MNYFLIRFTILVLLLTFATHGTQAQNDEGKQNYTKTQVEKLIQQTEHQLNEVEKSNAAQIGRKEIEEIKDAIRYAKEFIEDKKIDQAYYQITLGITLFEKINAKVELNVSKQIYTQKSQKFNE